MIKREMDTGNGPVNADARALLVIDVQNYFFDQRSPAFLAGAPAVLPRINRLIAAARNAGWAVVYTRHRAPRARGNLMAARWAHLPAGKESDLWGGLERRAGEYVIGKEYYSAFMGTDLARVLAAKGIGQIVLCGAMTHLCIDTTARHGFMLGFAPVIVSDACCSKDSGYHRAALRCLRHGFAKVVTIKQLERLAVTRCTT